MSTEHPTLPDRAASRTCSRLHRLVHRRRADRRDERGMATAEYAVGTVAAVALVTVLIGVFRNSQFAEVLLELVIAIFKAVLGTGGFGL